MKNKLLLFFVLLFVLVACEDIDISQLSDEDLERLSDKFVVCNNPYIRVGTGCCLDVDNNSICDSDEVQIINETFNITFKNETNNIRINKINETNINNTYELYSFKKCYDKNLYLFNSDNEPVAITELCDDDCFNETCYSKHVYKQCYRMSNAIYWYDSLGEKQEKFADCEYGCENGDCIFGDLKIKLEVTDYPVGSEIQLQPQIINYLGQDVTFESTIRFSGWMIDSDKVTFKDDVGEHSVTIFAKYNNQKVNKTVNISVYQIESKSNNLLIVDKFGIECFEDSDCGGYVMGVMNEPIATNKCVFNKCESRGCDVHRDKEEQIKQLIVKTIKDGNEGGYSTSNEVKGLQTLLMSSSCFE
ncbi:MAG: hypothetical protein ABIC91_00055 [Nanoarchaeota archaeon]|nr:hypothetical protein [Nanoarchaeota archaeon]